MRFSERTAWELGENELAAAVRAARASGHELWDLTVANPTACGFVYDEAALLAPLSDAGALVYVPEPLGTLRAREAVCGYYGGAVTVDRVCLTTSTSEAYSFLFRLLCDPGDEVLVASPSYPLFDYIARLDEVRVRQYPLHFDGGGWGIDLHALETAITERTRAVIVVHPNNPTGNFVGDTERVALQRLCAERGLALIVDEVFLDYGLPGVTGRSFGEGSSEALTFVLSGISKVCGLPQMKASWMVARGPEKLVREAMERIEVVADTFLSMNAPVQFALPVWLALRRGIQAQIVERMVKNLAVMDEVFAGSSLQRLPMEAGWTVVVRVPQGVGFVERALGAGVIVQPGEFYGLGDGRVVMSLLTETKVWLQGLERLVGLER